MSFGDDRYVECPCCGSTLDLKELDEGDYSSRCGCFIIGCYCGTHDKKLDDCDED